MRHPSLWPGRSRAPSTPWPRDPSRPPSRQDREPSTSAPTVPLVRGDPGRIADADDAPAGSADQGCPLPRPVPGREERTPMSTQPRTPAGTPDGGRFEATSRPDAGMDATLVAMNTDGSDGSIY